MIGICTDSNSQIPAELVERFGIEVVPLSVRVDGVDYEEGVDLDADGFYRLFADGARPEVSTSQPSPGRFGQAYAQLADRGATQILSVHIGAAVSGTLNSARLAAEASPVSVRLVDTGTASFGIACCTWAAAQAIEDGADVEQAATVAESLAPHIGNVFVVGALDLVRAGGRAGGVADGDGVAILSLRDGEVRVMGRATSVDAGVDAMAEVALGWGERLNVAVGIADTKGRPLSAALERAVRAAPNVMEVVRYRIGPSVGAYTGPGTAGAFFYPAP